MTSEEKTSDEEMTSEEEMIAASDRGEVKRVQALLESDRALVNAKGA